jgi:hypothetical protein
MHAPESDAAASFSSSFVVKATVASCDEAGIRSYSPSRAGPCAAKCPVLSTTYGFNSLIHR